MILVHVEYKIKPGKRDEYVEAVRKADIFSRTQAEEGNLNYQYYASVDDENQIMLLETWKDKYAIQDHLKTEQAADLMAIKEQYVESTVFHTFKVVEK